MPEVIPVCRALAGCVEGDPLAAPPVGCSPADATRWFQRNKYPLLALATSAPAWLAGDATFQRELAAERAWYDTQRGEYLAVRDAWLERGIVCLAIKSAGNAPSFPHTSDNIDILVRREHGPAARDTLRRLGYVELRNIEEPRKFLFRKFHDGRCVSAIHLHEQVGWEVGFMDESALWARIRPAMDDPAVNVPSPEDAILINLAHACYENKLLRFNDVARVRHALRDAGDGLDWAYLERVAASRGWLDGLAFMLLVHAAVETALFGATLIPRAALERLEQLVRAHEFIGRRLAAIRAQPADLPLNLSYPFCKRLYYRKILADPARTAGQRRYDVAATLLAGIKLKSGLRPQPGAIVTISGPDGSGKTAHARALVEALDLADIKASYVWNRGGSTGLLGLVSRARRRLRPAAADRDSAAADSVTRRRGRLASPPARFAWSWLVAADQVGTYLLRARLPALRGRVVVLDRYAYDTAVEMDASLPAGARWSRLAIAAMLALVPRPQLGYVLDVPPETARERKRDEAWHPDLEGERDAYRALAQRFGLRTLSTEGAFARSNDPLIREVIMTYMRGFETWRNALFLANPSQMNPPDRIWAGQGPGGAR
ncbi:MAG TPA: nucleotidyltransferase family protein [Thermomicrobiales bacterium]|nr:nucleotidyltransferase family protein [Thermomicrobiales bacterium]